MANTITNQPIGQCPPHVQSRPWSTGLCSLFDNVPICLFGACCPTLLGCHLAHKYGENCLLGIAPGGLVALRTHMRLSYGIEGTICNDALMMLCCFPCETCRMVRELRIHTG